MRRSRAAGSLCALVLVASIVGGMIPVWFQLTHRWMQFAVSFVAGVMLGVAVLHMLPHAIADAVSLAAARSTAPQSGVFKSDPATMQAIARTMIALLAGMMAMLASASLRADRKAALVRLPL